MGAGAKPSGLAENARCTIHAQRYAQPMHGVCTCSPGDVCWRCPGPCDRTACARLRPGRRTRPYRPRAPSRTLADAARRRSWPVRPPRQAQAVLRRRSDVAGQVMTSGSARPVRARMRGDLLGGPDEVGEGVGGGEAELLRVVLVALDVDAQGGAGGAGAGEAEDDAAAALEQDADALLRRDGAVDGVLVGEVVGGGDLEAGDLRAGQGGEPGAQAVHQGVGGGGVDALVVVAGVVVAAVLLPVRLGDLLGRLLAGGEDVEPEQDRPEAVLLADVVGAGAGALLAADGGEAGVEQVAEELPARSGSRRCRCRAWRRRGRRRRWSAWSGRCRRGPWRSRGRGGRWRRAWRGCRTG